MYKGEKIAWLAFEGLIRQDIKRPWELIIAEETGKGFTGCGQALVDEYEKRLAKANCVTVKYLELDKRVVLWDKWKLIAKEADLTSKALVLQDQDCFSPPDRLRISYHLLSTGWADWVHYPKGIYYDMVTDSWAKWVAPTGRPTGLNITVKPDKVRSIIHTSPKFTTGLNKHLLEACQETHREFQAKWIPGESWKSGMDTNGVNYAMHTDQRANAISNNAGVWKVLDFDPYSKIPPEIIGRVRQIAEKLFGKQKVNRRRERPW
jgi:hypothetical protein